MTEITRMAPLPGNIPSHVGRLQEFVQAHCRQLGFAEQDVHLPAAGSTAERNVVGRTALAPRQYVVLEQPRSRAPTNLASSLFLHHALKVTMCRRHCIENVMLSTETDCMENLNHAVRKPRTGPPTEPIRLPVHRPHPSVRSELPTIVFHQATRKLRHQIGFLAQGFFVYAGGDDPGQTPRLIDIVWQ